VLVAAGTGWPAEKFETRPLAMRILYTGAAVIVNTVPFVSAIVAPKCLPGYVFCKFGFASFATAAAGLQLALSGGADMAQTKAILYRGYAGDWIATGAHVAGDARLEPWPDPPPSTEGGGGFTPPPL
jgi:hypothetical protein